MKTLLKLLLIGTAVILVLGLGSALGIYWYFSRDLPVLHSLEDYQPKLITEIYSDDGTLVAELAEEYRKIVPLESIPPELVKAFLAIEDARFYEHKGIDFYRILGALYHDLKERSRKEGGSTITMQLARTFFLSQKKVFSRKFKEMILAWRIDHYLTKDQILWLYLNQVYLGTNMGRNIYGVEAAAEQFFGKTVGELTLAECALLAGIPSRPARYSPIYHFDKAKQRQSTVLRRMVEEKMLSEEEAKLAESEPILLRVKGDPYAQDSAYFIEAVRRYLIETYGEKMTLTGGLKVFTTLNLSLQSAATQAVRNGLAGPEGLDKRQGYRGPIAQVKEEEREAYLEKQEERLKAEWRYKNMTRGGDPLAQAPSPVPLELAQTYQGVVLEVLEKENRLKLGVGLSRGWIFKEGYQWALRGRSLEKVFQPGDVILVSVMEIVAPSSGKNLEYKFRLEQEPLAEAGLLAFSVRTGEVKALIGGSSFSRTHLIRPLQSYRQPGSAFKPVLYAAALDHPTKGFTPATIIYDSPDVFQYTRTDEDGRELVTWKPENYADRFSGPTTLRRAIEASINTISVKVVGEIGIDYARDYIRKLGIKSEMKRDLSIALGSSPVSLLELTRAYNVFASGGYLVEPYLIQRIYDREGNLLEWHSPQAETEEILGGDFSEDRQETIVGKKKEKITPVNPKEVSEPGFSEYLAMLREGKIPSRAGLDSPVQGTRVISSQLAYLMTNLLEGVIARGTGWRAKVLGRPLAGKTGTTNQFRDAWFIGYSPELICGVWVGFDDYARSLGPGEAGAKTALPIWIDFMKQALAQTPVLNFPVPENIEFARIDQKTGLLASTCSNEVITETFIAGTAPNQFSPCGAIPHTQDLLRGLDY